MANGIFAYRHYIRELIQEDDTMKILEELHTEEEEEENFILTAMKILWR